MASRESFSLVDILRLLVGKVTSSPTARGLLLLALGLKLVAHLARKKRCVKGKLVLITGAATGIGREQAFVFSKAGARVVLWDIAFEALQKTADDVRSATGGEVHAYKVNLADREEVYAVAADTKKAHGVVWCLVNNARVSLPRPLAREDLPRSHASTPRHETRTHRPESSAARTSSTRRTEGLSSAWP